MQAILIEGMGTTLPSHVYLDSPFSYSFVNPTSQVKYYAGESQAGMCRLMSFKDECGPQDVQTPMDVDFAASTSTLSQAVYQKYPDLQMYPTLAAAIVPIYNLNGVQGLILSKVTLAQIFSGQIRTWDDAQIKEINPNFTHWNIPANQTIEVVVRKESSDITTVFKRALAAFWPSFASLVNVSHPTKWGNLTTTQRQGYEGVNTYILQNPWTISYSVYGDARDFYVPQAKLMKVANVIVEASMESTTYAVLEMGLNFGNNGDDPSQLTADLNNAQGVNAWPIVTYTYVVLRKSTLRKGATCEHVAGTVAFWYWFYTADAVLAVTNRHFFVRLPSVVSDLVTQRLIQDITCLGNPVFEQPPSTVLQGRVDSNIAPIFEKLVSVYPIVHPDVSVQYTEGELGTATQVAETLTANDFVTVHDRGLSPKGTATFIFAGIGLAVISQYNVMLDMDTLLGILEGDIQTWLHPALQALNPDGITDNEGHAITDANQSIILFNGPASETAFFRDLMQAASPTFTGKALYAAQKQAVDEVLRYFVAGTPYSLSVTPFIGEFSLELNFASFRRSDGNVVAPSPASILACASPDVYSEVDNSFDLMRSANSGCYPLADTMYLTVNRPSCAGLQQESEPPLVEFVAWLLRSDTSDASLKEQHLAPLRTASVAAIQANTAAMRFLSCTAATTSSANLLPIIVGACVGGLFAIAVPAGWLFWKSTKDLRVLRKQFSDANVAQECAEAIACFDLDAVAWLATVKQPSKIQLAFLHIINLLNEVKPFIPDQLLAQLLAPHRQGSLAEPLLEEASGRERTEDTCVFTDQTLSSSASLPHLGVSPHGSGSTQTEHARRLALLSDSQRRTMEGAGRRLGRNGHHLHPHGPAMGLPGERVRKACTYMFIRFGWNRDMGDEAAGAMSMTVAAHVVTVAKAHGATIDKVTYDSVALHWNVSLNAAGAPLHAATLALELAKTKEILPPTCQEALRLLIGVGHGICTVATVSAAGQRFFVVGGREVTTAVEVVMRDLAVPLGCSILLTNSMQQEVQYTFRCFPRLWYRDTLLWEPVEGRRGMSKNDEWMYALQHMEAREEAYSGKVLWEVFLLARSTQSRALVQEQVTQVEQLYGPQMSPQDTASLRLLCESLDTCDLLVSTV
eukprot:GGOE01013477.1.p1 GENE.GGOE01013477.1~~GGOE01013477.1.p1  ORF type:complete len:1165 (+),score=295.59 GGOE01013477.1:79-3495(+)